MGLCILRLREGMDYSELIAEESQEQLENLTRAESQSSGFGVTPPGTPNSGRANQGFSIEPEGGKKKKKKDPYANMR